MKKLLTITLPSLLIAAIAVAAVIEVTVRLTWDTKRGRPGIFVSDPVRLERLARNYDGWFAGVPVRTNSLGFRDNREYALEKGPRTFRILVLGDSVTFGHGSLYEHTYPYLLEQALRAWKRDVDWQVWNLGVPGYNTSQELATLLDVGATYQPDLVIVGFYDNDVLDNEPIVAATARRRAVSRVKSWVRQHMYSADWYRKQYLLMRSRLLASGSEQLKLQELAGQEILLARGSDVVQLKEQQLSGPKPMTDEDLQRDPCAAPAVPFPPSKLEAMPGFDRWKATVRRLQQLNRDGIYRIVFFINSAPPLCLGQDRFDPRVSHELNEYLLTVLGDGTPAVSSHDAFAQYRPSQMPLAGGHSIGNSNALKANLLFEFLKVRVLPPLVSDPAVKTP